MKRSLCLLLAAAICLLLAGSALGVPGDRDDPVVSLQYLTAVYQPALTRQAQTAAAKTLYTTYNAAFTELTEQAALANYNALRRDQSPHSAEGVVLLKSGDVLTLEPGCQAVLRTGALVTDSANLICVTDGTATASGASLAAGKLYMKNDAADGGFRVTSESAEVYLSGVYSRQTAATTDYGSLADALCAMGLFRGTGKGYALQTTATRAEGLVMFLRMLGLEEEALAYNGSCPFLDTKPGDWHYRYIAYAYSCGLTSGTSATTFSPSGTITAQQYITFLMRALHYQEGTDFRYNTVLTDCVTKRVFLQKEVSAMSAGKFLRCKMVYLSYYSLFAPNAETGQMLISQLVGSGAVPLDAMRTGVCTAASPRVR